MKKILLSALAFSLFAGGASAQAFQWANGYSSQMAPQKVASDGHSVVSLGLFSGSMQVLNQTFVTQDSADSYIVKNDLYGNTLWAKHIQDIGFQSMTAVAADEMQNVIVAGMMRDSITIGNTTIYSPTTPVSNSMVLLKFNAAGSLVWYKIFTTTGGGYPQVAAVTTDEIGNIYATGNYANTATFGSTTLTATGNNDIFVVKCDAGGNVVWANNAGSSDYDNSTDIAVAASGDVYVTGVFSASGQLGGQTAAAGMFLAKYNAAGAVQRVQSISNGAGLNTITGLALDASQNAYLTGNFGTSLTLGTINLTGTNARNSFIAKTNDSGNWLWADKLTSSSNYADAQDIHINNLGDVYVSGGLMGSASFDNINVATVPTNSLNSFIAKYDATGLAQWVKLVNTNSNNYTNAAASLTSDINGDVYMGGRFDGTAMFGSVTKNVPWGGAYVAKIMDGASSVNGTVFIDTNGNGSKDSGEIGMADVIVEATSGPLYVNSGANGDYTANLVAGNYTLALPSVPTYYSATPASHTASFTALGQSVANKNFALVPTPNMNDIQATVTNITPARPGRHVSYQITLKNVGTTALSDSIAFNFDNSIMTYSGASVTPAVQNSSSLKWTYQNMQPNESRNFTATFMVNQNATLGTPLMANTAAKPFIGDQFVGNNYDTLNHAIVTSYDPNDKQVSHSTLTPAQANSGEFIEYTIRFQNTGNDTAFVVSIMDSLSTKVNVGSLQVLAASHSYRMFVKEAGIVEWRFDNILLPDSNVNEAASHGFVRYRVKPNTGLAAGDEIQNTAAIYFDFNTPVITNTAVTRIQNPAAINKNLIKNISTLSLYPNPASESFVVEAELEKAQPVTLQLRNLLGQQLQTVELGEMQKVQHRLNIQSLPKGVYLLQLQAGAETVTQRIVIE